MKYLLVIFRERFPYYDIVKSERGTPEFVHDEKTRFSPEELVAQMLAKAKDFAEISHGEKGNISLNLHHSQLHTLMTVC